MAEKSHSNGCHHHAPPALAPFIICWGAALPFRLRGRRGSRCPRCGSRSVAVVFAPPASTAVARGKNLHDKRETEKKRSWERERGRLMRMKG